MTYIDDCETNVKPEIISYSEVSKWDTCQRQYYYRFIKNLSPLEESHAITTGVKGHKLLQSFYEEYRNGKTKEEALHLTRDRAKKLMESEKFADFDLLTAWTLVDNYIRGNTFPSETLLVENRFILPFAAIDDDPEFETLQIGFTPDVVFQRAGGFIDVEDSKFIQKAWSKPKLNRFSQAKLYQIFLQILGYNVSRSIIRFFNVKTGVITPQNYILEPGEDVILLRDFATGVKEVMRYRRSDPETISLARRTMNYSTCQFCAFEVPCTLEAENKSAEKTFKYFFKKSDYSYDI